MVVDVLAAVPLQPAIIAPIAPRDKDKLRIRSCWVEIQRCFRGDGFLQFSKFMAGIHLSRFQFDRAKEVLILMTWIGSS
jgi:hypothetical protein